MAPYSFRNRLPAESTTAGAFAMTFGLKSLLVGMAMLAVMLFLLFAAPVRLAVPLLTAVWVVLTAFFAGGIIYGRGSWRAFCIGAMFPVGGTFFALVWVLFLLFVGGFNNLRNFQELFEYTDKFAFVLRVWSAAGGITTVLCGAASVAAGAAFSPITTGSSNRSELDGSTSRGPAATK